VPCRLIPLLLAVSAMVTLGAWRLYENHEARWKALVPPRLVVESQYESIQGTLFSYCWSNGDIAECRDSYASQSGPLILATPGERLRLDYSRNPAPRELRILFEPADGPPEDVHPLAAVDFIQLPSTTGHFKVVIGAHWAGEERRNAQYLFQVYIAR